MKRPAAIQPDLPRGRRFRADLILLFVAFVWGSGFAAARVAGQVMDPLVYNGLRFLVGALTLLPLMRRHLRGFTRMEWVGGVLAGLVLLGAANTQQVGLEFTTAGKAGFITGLYVVLVPLFIALVSRKWPHWLVWIASLLAATGLFLLSSVESLALAPGDGWVLLGAVLWAVHIVVIGVLAAKINPLRLALVQYVVCGLLSILLGLLLNPQPLAGWDVAWWAILYNGVLAVGLGLTLQVVGQRVAPAADAAVILSLEAVFAALFGWLLLGELLSVQQFIGCGLMMAGMLLAQARTFARGRA